MVYNPIVKGLFDLLIHFLWPQSFGIIDHNKFLDLIDLDFNLTEPNLLTAVFLHQIHHKFYWLISLHLNVYQAHIDQVKMEFFS